MEGESYEHSLKTEGTHFFPTPSQNSFFAFIPSEILSL